MQVEMAGPKVITLDLMDGPATTSRFEDWLGAFGLDRFIHLHVAAVMEGLPGEVRDDFLTDPSFRMSDYEPGRGVVMHVPVASPGFGKPSRAVVLKRTLRHRPIEFVRYVIAHELAHAHLFNRGRSPEEDPEHAADELAKAWGFPRPT
jgi:hypothetical protein